MINFIDIKN